MNVTVADRNISFTLYFEDIKLLNKDFEQTTFNNIMVTVTIISILVVNSLVLIWLKSKVLKVCSDHLVSVSEPLVLCVTGLITQKRPPRLFC